MGSWSDLLIDDLEIYSVKNTIDPYVLLLFTEEDKRVRPFSADYFKADDWEEDHPKYIVDYSVSVSVARDRLEFYGITLPFVRQAFEEGIEDLLSTKQESQPVLKGYTFEDWVHCFAQIIKNPKLRHSFLSNRQSGHDQLTPLMRYMLEQSFDFGFGFPFRSPYLFIRAAIEAVESTATLTYDITNLIADGYFDLDDKFCELPREELIEDFALNRKIIVLTEGISDSKAIERSLKLLYPHLADYYSFIDFEGAKVQGGAGALASMIKAFIGAEIAHRIVAFFDNDTAAHAAMRSLRNITIPPNVKVLRYPELELARSYPTLGPQGIAELDINGLATSLELFFGTDVLKDDNDKLTPVQWKGFDEAMQQYQGEIMHKSKLQEKFKNKLASCESDKTLIPHYDWSGIDQILHSLRYAFQNEPVLGTLLLTDRS